MQSTSWETLDWKKHKLESRLPGEISITSDMQQKVKRNSKASWWKWKWRVKKLALSSTFRKWRTWHPVPSHHGKSMGKQWKLCQTFFGGAPKSLQMVTAAMKLKDTRSLEEKLWQHRKPIKSRDITLSTKVHLVKATVFPVVMYGCESWIVKKADDAFEVWCWRRLLRVPWTARRSNQSILKEISPGYSLEGLMLKLKLQYFSTSCKELTHWKRPWCWEGLRTEEKGMTEDEMAGWHHWLDGH